MWIVLRLCHFYRWILCVCVFDAVQLVSIRSKYLEFLFDCAQMCRSKPWEFHRKWIAMRSCSTPEQGNECARRLYCSLSLPLATRNSKKNKYILLCVHVRCAYYVLRREHAVDGLSFEVCSVPEHIAFVVRYSMFRWSLNHLLTIFFFLSFAFFRFSTAFFDTMFSFVFFLHFIRFGDRLNLHTYICRLTELWQRVRSTRCNIFPTSGVQIYQFVMSDQTKRIKKKKNERKKRISYATAMKRRKRKPKKWNAFKMKNREVDELSLCIFFCISKRMFLFCIVDRQLMFHAVCACAWIADSQ